MSFTNLLTWWQWAIVAAVPPAILALYFLKLKRRPIEVPSTYLWHKSIEDLHVNSLLQKLKNNILLFLQLLVMALAILALARPSWQGTELAGERFIFLIDNSASMGASDDAPNRLDVAKKQVVSMIDTLPNGAAAMILSFADSARVEQSWTVNRAELLRRLAQIQLTERSTDLREALEVAAGLANPNKTSDAKTVNLEERVAQALPATIYIFSDGRSTPPKDFALGNLSPVYVPMGIIDPAPANVGILSFATRRNEETKNQLQAFGRVANFGAEKVSFDIALYADGGTQPIDAKQVNLDPFDREKNQPGAVSVAFDLTDFESGILEMRAEIKDALASDNRAWATVNPPQPARVLVIAGENKPLDEALSTERAKQLADVTWKDPEYLKTPEYKKLAESGGYHLIIYDGLAPDTMPQANTFLMGAIPTNPPAPATAEAGKTDPAKEAPPEKEKTETKAGEEPPTLAVRGWSCGPVDKYPTVLDIDRNHPLMNLVEMSDIAIGDTLTSVSFPQGGSVLIDAHRAFGPLLSIAPREGYQDAVLAFRLVKEGKPNNTDWWVKPSFPVFMLNVLTFLGGGADSLTTGNVRPGATVPLRGQAASQKITIQRTLPAPADEPKPVERSNRNTYDFADTDRQGVYEVQWGGDRAPQHFAVNLFDSDESDILTRKELTIGSGEAVEGSAAREVARKETWKTLLLIGLAVLLVEWYLYNRRVAL
jgi:hypothetical protein